MEKKKVIIFKIIKTHNFQMCNFLFHLEPIVNVHKAIPTISNFNVFFTQNQLVKVNYINQYHQKHHKIAYGTTKQTNKQFSYLPVISMSCFATMRCSSLPTNLSLRPSLVFLSLSFPLVKN